jgi:hypothetical protein
MKVNLCYWRLPNQALGFLLLYSTYILCKGLVGLVGLHVLKLPGYDIISESFESSVAVDQYLNHLRLSYI